MEMSIINSLLGIEREISLCYQEHISIELSGKTCFDKIKKIYENIGNLRYYESVLISKLKRLYLSDEKITELYDYILSLCNFLENEHFLVSYVEWEGKRNKIEIYRLLKLFSSEFSDILSPKTVQFDDCFVEEFGLFDMCTFDDNEFFEPYLEQEDRVRIINKIDNILCNKLSSELSREELCQIKYDMFFLDHELESMLISEYSIPNLSYFDAMDKIAKETIFSDEEIIGNCDSVRENDMWSLFDRFSQRRNKNCSLYKSKLFYFVFGLWKEALDSESFDAIMASIQENIADSYNSKILDAREEIYYKLCDIYDMNFEQSDEIEVKEKKKKKAIKKNKALSK